MLRAVSSNQVASWNPAQNAAGVLPAGPYAQNPANGNGVVVASRTTPSFTYAPGAAASTPFDVMAVPANAVGQNGWAEFEIKWSASATATSKIVQVTLGHNNLEWTDSLVSPNISSTLRFTVHNRGTTQAQLGSATGNGGQSATAFGTYAVDFTQEQRFTIWAATNGTSDTIRIESWTVKVFNPPVYSAARNQYGTPQFYGANAHFDDTQSIAMHIAGMKTMGMKLMRITYEGGSSLSTIQSYAQAFQTDGTGLKLLVCLDMSISPDGSVLYASEAAAYAAAFSAAQLVASTLAPYGVKLYECGNEMDTKFGINTNDPQGGLPSDFDNTKVTIFRGIQRGAIAGIRSVPGCLAGSNAYTVCSIGLSDMMWFGTQPDGTTGHPLVRPDFMCWHNYEDYGPLNAVEMGNSRPWVNIYEYLNRRYGGLPIYITEWNGKSSDTDPQRASWASRHMYEAYVNRYRWNIASIIVYELYGGPWNVLDGVANTPVSTFGTTVQSFITSNPDTGL